METFDHDTQESRLRALIPYLRERPIETDAYGAPMIKGRTGYIYASPEGFQVVCLADDARQWAITKRRLGKLCQVTQDGDEEGILLLKKRRLSLAESNDIAMAICL